MLALMNKLVGVKVFQGAGGCSGRKSTMTRKAIWERSFTEWRASVNFSSSHVQMWELGHKEGWALKNWCFQTVVPEKTLESPLDSREIKPVHPKGNEPWIFIGSTDAEAPILWPPDTKSRLVWKDIWSYPTKKPWESQIQWEAIPTMLESEMNFIFWPIFQLL